ncbi:DnaA regulatory inactivator HdaA [Aliihoeflea sp. PC F10.4]
MKSPQQLPFDLAHRAATSRDDIVPSVSIAPALHLIDHYPDWPAAVVVLVGPAGSGKTHLAHAWQDMTGAVSPRPGHLAAAALDLAEGGPVLIDDVDVGTIDETGLFHLINAVRSSGTHLLMTASTAPASWPITLPDLASRLKAASVVEIGAPDDMLLEGVLTKLFADRQVEVEPSVVQYVVKRMERSLEAAGLLVAELDRLALARKSRITRALAAEVVDYRQS